MKFKEHLNLLLIILYFLLIYFSFQFHEAGHWVIATLLGYEIIVTPIGVHMLFPGNNLEMLAILIAGPLFGVFLTIIGLLFLFRREEVFLKRVGFFLVFIQGFGGLLYDLSVNFGITGDHQGIALILNISEYIIRIPFIIFNIVSLLFLLKDASTGYKSIKWIFLFGVMFILGIIGMLAFEFFTWQQIYGKNILFQPILGYPPFLLITNSINIIGILFLIKKHMIQKNNPSVKE